MSAISDYAAKRKEHDDRNAKAIETLVTSVGGITSDFKELNDKLTEIQNNPGPISPQDQTLLTDSIAASEGITTRLEAVAQALEALDAQRAPTPPPVETGNTIT